MMEAMRDIREGRKLTDDVILPALRMINAFTGVAFVEPAVLMTFQCGTLPDLSGFPRAMLIIHLGMVEGDGHWVLATFENGVVSIFDSMNSMVICPQLKATVAGVFGEDKPITTVPVATPQTNSNDCGVLALAYAVDWALGYNPAIVEYDYGSLRHHLLTILRDRILVPFPRVMEIHVENGAQRVAQLSPGTVGKEQQRRKVSVPTKISSQEERVGDVIGNNVSIAREEVAPHTARVAPITEEAVANAAECIADSADDNASIDSDSGDDLERLKGSVVKLLREDYGIKVETYPKSASERKVTRNDKFLGLCHIQKMKINYYSVMAFFPDMSSDTFVYDFCGRKYVSHLSKKELAFQSCFSSQVTLNVKKAPCKVSNTDPTRSCLLSLLTMLYLARGMDPLAEIEYEVNDDVLKERLAALIDESVIANQQEQVGVSVPGQNEAQQIDEENEVDTEDTRVLKVRVMERIEEIKYCPVIEYPKFSESSSTGDFFGLIRIFNKQSGNDYYSVLHCPDGEEIVMIHDFCGRTYTRDIHQVEKKFAARAVGIPGVRCKLMRYPTVATKKDTEKCLLYSLLTLLCLAQGKNIFDIIDPKSDAVLLKVRLCQLLRGEQVAVSEARPVRPLFQRRRMSTDMSTDLGGMDVTCYCCGARYFSCEVVEKSGPQPKCCKEGKVTLPRRRDTPDVLRRLMTEDNAEAKHFRAFIYRYNSALAFASLHAECPTLGRGAPAFIVQGQMYTTMYPGMAGNESTPKANQMYFLDIEQGVASRVDAYSGLQANVVKELLEMLDECNPYAAIYVTMREYVNARGSDVPQVDLAMRADFNAVHRGMGGMPTSDEVVVVYRPTENEEFGSMAVYSVTGEVPRKVHLNSPSAEPMLFPLLNPRGESGYVRNEQRRFTLREYCMYFLSRREEFSTMKYGGRLKQAYICFQCLKIEDDRLSWFSRNQGTVRAEMYKGLHDWLQRRAQEANVRVGRVVVLPASFTGGPRYMHRKYLDSLAAVCHFGRYDLFITLTTNPRWPEITANMPPGQTVADNCDLVNRVFHAKLMKFIELIEKQQILGDVAAWLYVIEFQKRGLPHAHFVLIFTPQYSADTAGRVDQLITAEIPEEEGLERELMLEFMLHEPCASRPSAKCRRGPGNECRHNFPKDFCSETRYGGTDHKTVYRRRPSKKPGMVNNQVVDNDYVVPTNMKLLKALRCHVNVEVYQALLGVKYLFKYLQKGESRDTIQIRYDLAGEPGIAVSDEVRHFQSHRYLSCYEADWRIRASPVTECSHAVVRLPVHLPSEQMVYFMEGEEEEALRSADDKHSQLEAWFLLNRKDPAARSIKYVDIPVHYVWSPTRRIWERRQKRGERMIVRMYDVPPSMGELFYLRLILLHRTGATSYEDLRTVSGTVHETFREACQAMGILADDSEYIRCLTDAVSVKAPAALRRLFVQILCFGAPTDPRGLYEKFSRDMSDDYRGDESDEVQRKRHLDVRLRASLERLGYDFISNAMDFLLHYTETLEELLPVGGEATAPASADRRRALEESFNEGQRAAYDAIMAAVEGGRNSLGSRAFFLDGAAGTGKTHVLNAVIEIVESRMHRGLVFSMAWSGLAASLLRRGQTVHSTLKLQFAMDESTKVGLTFHFGRALFLRDSPLIIWDEISMSHVKAFTAFDSWLRLLMGSDRPFGDKVVVFAGDFKQILPVVPSADPASVVKVIVKNSVTWRSVKSLRLWESMRVSREEREFSEFLLAVGEGNIPVPHGIPLGCIVIPNDVVCSKQDLVAFVRHPDVSVDDAIILSVRNSDVDDMNSLVAKFSFGEMKTYLSSDCNAFADDTRLGENTDPQYRHNLPVEYLNRMNPPHMPPHILTLRVGQPVMLLRNLDVAAGLCNGKRLIVTELRDNLVICSRRDSPEPVLLCRHRFSTVENRDAVPFVRLQYPIKLAYACTVHKSQGQTFGRVGVYLRHSVFTHGMLYVAMSRVKRGCDLKICIEEGDSQGTVGGVSYTRNVVFHEALQ